MKIRVFTLLAGASFLMSCAHDVIVYNPPTVTVTTADTIHSYQNGDTIQFSVTMSDDDALHESMMYIITPADTDTLFMYDPYVHELPSYSLDTFCVVNGITALNDGFITVTATNHHDGFTEIDVPITVFP